MALLIFREPRTVAARRRRAFPVQEKPLRQKRFWSNSACPENAISEIFSFFQHNRGVGCNVVEPG
jgi:hypothetical protein